MLFEDAVGLGNESKHHSLFLRVASANHFISLRRMANKIKMPSRHLTTTD